MKILRFEIDNVEFFINEDSTETGLSVSGLARLCGVEQSSITRLLDKLKSLMHKTPLEEAQTHASNDKSLMHKTPKSVMNKTPLEEAQTHASNDKSVMHKTPKSKGGRPKKTEEDLAPSLKILLDGDIYLDIGNQYKNATVLNERSCSAILYYYAVQSEEKPPEAQQALWQFQQNGFRNWIYDVTGWHPPRPSRPMPEKPLTRAEQLGITPRTKECLFDRHMLYNDLLNRDLSAPMYRLYLYLMDCDYMQHRPTIDEICTMAQISKRRIYDLVERMRPLCLIPNWLELDPSSRSLEAQIRDRLHAELGGDIEVQTLHGPVDLLTETEMIEVKRIEDWKTGFGQIMAKANEFPHHTKRLHLFGASKRNLENIKLVCSEFDITVSHEVKHLVMNAIECN